MGEDHWPTHAYIPGKTARHPECTFDAVRETAHAGLTPTQLAQSRAFRLGLRYIEAGYFWEAHEVLEPVWMALPNPGRERQFVQALIQIANGFLKLKMGRPKAAARLENISKGLLAEMDQTATMGVQGRAIGDLLKALKDQIESAL